MKFTDHQVQTPIAHVNLSCQTCHNYTETELQSRVDQIQSRTKGQLDRAEIVVVELIEAIKQATEATRRCWRHENCNGAHSGVQTL